MVGGVAWLDVSSCSPLAYLIAGGGEAAGGEEVCCVIHGDSDVSGREVSAQVGLQGMS